jgi:hypothetical protein
MASRSEVVAGEGLAVLGKVGSGLVQGHWSIFVNEARDLYLN